MRRLLLFAAGLALLAAPAASAHVTVTPSLVAPGSSRLFVFSMPNERIDADLTGLVLELPRGVAVEEVEAVPGWTAVSAGRKVSWRGGRIAPGQFATFSLRAAVPEQEGAIGFKALELFADGPGPTFDVGVVVAAVPKAAGPKDAGARTLGKAALAVAGGAALLALLGGLLALSVWLRAPRRGE